MPIVLIPLRVYSTRNRNASVHVDKYTKHTLQTHTGAGAKDRVLQLFRAGYGEQNPATRSPDRPPTVSFPTSPWLAFVSLLHFLSRAFSDSELRACATLILVTSSLLLTLSRTPEPSHELIPRMPLCFVLQVYENCG